MSIKLSISVSMPGEGKLCSIASSEEKKIPLPLPPFEWAQIYKMKLFWSTATVFLLLALGAPSRALQIDVASGSSQKSNPNTQIQKIQIGFIEAPQLVSGQPSERFPQGSRLVRLAMGAQPGTLVNLTPQFFAVADPQISFDGTQVLFSAQTKKNSGWQIWEMNADGSHPRQLTECLGDCLQPAYLPRNQIVYTAISGNGPQRSSALYVCQENGQNAHPITFGPGNFHVETVLHSGRILVSAASPLLAGGKERAHRSLYTIRPDGTGLHLLRQGADGGSVHTGAQELEDGTVLFVEGKDGAGQQVGGELASVLPGALQAAAITAGPSVYESAHELQAGTLLVAKQNSGASAGNRTFGLYSFDLTSRTLGDLLYRQPKVSDISPVPITAHSAPLYYPSILHLDERTGRILCLDSHVSADFPHGQIATPIAQVRVVALEAGNHERILGNAPVEKDGSFYLAVPSDMPIRFELLDARGAVIRAQKSWIWARPGEDRGCLGCHEKQALAPENRWPLTLNRSDTPTPVGVPVHPQESTSNKRGK